MTYNKTLSEGKTEFIINNNEAGTYTASFNYKGNSTFESSVTSSIITFKKQETQILVDDYHSFIGETITLQATLQSIMNNDNPMNLPNMTLTFSEEGTVLGTATTNENGVASFDYTITDTDTVITVEFLSNNIYQTSDETISITGDPKVNTSITLTGDYSFAYTDTVTIVASLSCNTVETLEYYIDNVKQGTITTNNSGVAEISLSNLTIGSHTLKVVFNGNTGYNSSEVSQTLTVTDKTATSIISWTYNSKFIYKKPQTISACLNVSLSTNIGIYIDDVLYTTVTSDNTGLFTVTITDWTIGSHIIQAKYEGDNHYKACSSSITVTATDVIKTSITSVSYDNNVVYTQGSNIQVKLTDINSTALPNKPIYVYEKNSTNVTATGTTDSNGIFSYTFDNLVVGDNYIEFIFLGDNTYNSTGLKFYVTATSRYSTGLNSWVKPSNPTVKTAGQYEFTLQYKKDDTLYPLGGNVKIYVDDILQETVTTYSSTGKKAFYYTPKDTNTHTIKASYEGTDIYMPTTTSFTITAKSKVTNATISTSNFTFKHNDSATADISPTVTSNVLNSGREYYIYWNEHLIPSAGNWTLTTTVLFTDTKGYQLGVINSPSDTRKIYALFQVSANSSTLIYVNGNNSVTLTTNYVVTLNQKVTFKIVKEDGKIKFYMNDDILYDEFPLKGMTEDEYFFFRNWGSDSGFNVYNIKLEEFSSE